jgi:hypothetical protein
MSEPSHQIWTTNLFEQSALASNQMRAFDEVVVWIINKLIETFVTRISIYRFIRRRNYDCIISTNTNVQSVVYQLRILSTDAFRDIQMQSANQRMLIRLSTGSFVYNRTNYLTINSYVFDRLIRVRSPNVRLLWSIAPINMSQDRLTDRSVSGINKNTIKWSIPTSTNFVYCQLVCSIIIKQSTEQAIATTSIIYVWDRTNDRFNLRRSTNSLHLLRSIG